jgi:hypothetical protein
MEIYTIHFLCQDQNRKKPQKHIRNPRLRRRSNPQRTRYPIARSPLKALLGSPFKQD